MYPVTLIGRVVTLREFRSDDAADSLAIVGDDQVTRWLSFDSRDIDAAQAMIDGAVQRAQDVPRAEYYLAVTGESGELVGFARLALTGVKAAKLGYAIRADRWGKGYATDAVQCSASSNSASTNCSYTASPPLSGRTIPPPSP